MPLRVYYRKRLGYFTAVENHSDGVHYFKIGIYDGNVLAAFVHRYLSRHDNKRCAMLYAFFADEQHMKNIEKDHSPKHPFFDIKGAVHLNTAYPKQHRILRSSRAHCNVV